MHEKIGRDSHRTVDRQITYDVFCSDPIHQSGLKKKIKKYCQQCQCYVCDSCEKESHHEHNAVELKTRPALISSIEIDKIIERAKELKNTKVNEFTRQIDELNKRIKDIQNRIALIKRESTQLEDAYRKYEATNLQLGKLITSVNSTIELTSGYGNYNLIKTAQYLKDNYTGSSANSDQANPLEFNQLLEVFSKLIIRIEPQQLVDI